MTLDNSETHQVTEPASRARLLLPALLCLLFVVQCVWFISTQSLTNDEPEHISAGLEAWRYGEFKAWDAHPPLGRLWFAVPLLFTDWAYSEYRGGVQPARPGPEVWAWRTRPMNSLSESRMSSGNATCSQRARRVTCDATWPSRLAMCWAAVSMIAGPASVLVSIARCLPRARTSTITRSITPGPMRKRCARSARSATVSPARASASA